MQQLLEFFRKLFETSDWPPFREYGSWSTFHGWFYILSNLLIWSAYLAIPIIIFRYLSRRTDSKFGKTYTLFAIFLLFCGSTYAIDALTFWVPLQRFSALIRFFTGVASWVTVYHLYHFLPVASSMRTHAALESEIAERERMESKLKIANEQLRIAQGIAKIGHWQWEVEPNIISWSNELYNIYGVDANWVINYNTYLTRIHPEDRDFVDSTIKTAFAEKKFPNFFHRILMKDGTEKIIQSSGEIVTNDKGEVVRMIGTAQDITETHRAQQELLERTHELETTNADLQKFAYVASHDLQEPIRKIRTFVSVMEQELDAKREDHLRVYMEKINNASGRMQKLIDDILQFSSLRHVSEQLTHVNLGEVVEQVQGDLEDLIQKNNVQLQVGALPVIEAVLSQMGQLFQNLISNAIKFRREDVPSVIQIRSKWIDGRELNNYNWVDKKFLQRENLSYIWSREQLVQIEVEDNGIGFDADYSAKIFELFQRLHTTKTYQGTGIGLAICKKIVDNHHGLITAKGHPGKGALFTIIFPSSQKHFI